MVGAVGLCFGENQILISIKRGPRRGGRVWGTPSLLAHSGCGGSTTLLGAAVGEAGGHRQGKHQAADTKN